LVDVTILPPTPKVQILRSERKEVPELTGTALIDTGASITCISERVVKMLSLVAYDDKIDVGTGSGKEHRPLYDIGVILPVTTPDAIEVQAICLRGLDQLKSYDVLIGRDILSTCSLFYNGLTRTFTLHY
jgi:hypothetical protein